MRLLTRLLLAGLFACVVASGAFAQVGPVLLTISPGNSSTTVGTPQQMTARFAFIGNKSGGKDVTQRVTWVSSNATIATINNSGSITPIGRGTVTITATSGPFHASTTFTVIPSGPTVSSIAVTPAAPFVALGLKQQFIATASFSDSSTQNVTAAAGWSSTMSSVATITGGLARTLSQGTTTIMATFGGKNGSTTLTVTAPVFQRVSVAPQNFSLGFGLTQQYSAFAVYSDNSTVNVTSSSTWNSTSSGVATVGATTGLVTSQGPGTTTISAQYNAMMGSTQLTVILPTSISISPPNPQVALAGTLQLAAIGHFMDGSTSDLTNFAVWSSNNSGGVSVTTSGLITGNTVGAGATISATVGPTTGTTSATVGFSNASLNGHYAFQFNGADSQVIFLAAGDFLADGNGHLSGVEDFNGQSVQAGAAFTGTYSVGLDGRGSATLSTGDTLRFVITASGAGTVIEFNAFAQGSGTIVLQDVNAFMNSTLQGEFAFLFAGAGGDGKVTTAVGKLSADASGNIFSGAEDVNDGGILSSDTFTGSYTLGGNGRGTATTINNGKTTHYAFYIVNSNEVLFIGLDFTPAFLGFADRRSASTFSNGSLGGAYVFSEGGVTTSGVFAAVGRFNADGAGNISLGVEDENNAGGVAENLAFSGSYSIASNGRGTATLNSTFGATHFVFYIVSPTVTFFMDTDSNAVVSGNIEGSQNGGFSTSSLNGNFGLEFDGATAAPGFGLAVSAQMSADGSGNLTGTEDVNNNGTLTADAPLSGSYSIESNGRGTADITARGTTSRFHFYLASGNRVRIVEVSASELLLGFGLKQF